MARGADGDKYFSESADAEINRRLCETAPCTRRLDAVSDGTAVSRSLPAQCGQFLGRTFWRGRKLTLNLVGKGDRSEVRNSPSLRRTAQKSPSAFPSSAVGRNHQA